MADADVLACAGCGAELSSRVIVCPACGTPVGYRGGTVVARSPAEPLERLPERENLPLPETGSGGPNYSYRKAIALAALSVLFLQGVLYDFDLAWVPAPRVLEGVVTKSYSFDALYFSVDTGAPLRLDDGPRGFYPLAEGAPALDAGTPISIVVHSRYWVQHVSRIIGPPPANAVLYEEPPHQVSAPGTLWETGAGVFGVWAVAQTWIA